MPEQICEKSGLKYVQPKSVKQISGFAVELVLNIKLFFLLCIFNDAVKCICGRLQYLEKVG